MTKRVGVVTHDEMKKHCTFHEHPERPERIESIMKELAAQELLQKCISLPCREATTEELTFIHSVEYVTRVDESVAICKELEDGESHYLDPADKDCFLNEFTARAARLATGGLIDLVEKVMNDELDSGMAIIRPPGHHAEENKCMGFCFFNSVAVAAKVIQQKFNLQKVMIVDWDVHHGNGTQHLLENDNSILYFSVHRHDNGNFYPIGNSGSPEQIGKGLGAGFSVNVGWPRDGMGDAEYLSCFYNIVLPIAHQFEPDLILVSAGFDCALGDPLGHCNVTEEAFGHLTQLVLSCQKRGKVVLALEGGYNLHSLSKSCAQCISVLLGAPPSSLHSLPKVLMEGCPEDKPLTVSSQQKYKLADPALDAVKTMLATISAHKEHWVLEHEESVLNELAVKLKPLEEVKQKELKKAQRKKEKALRRLTRWEMQFRR